MYNSEFQSKKNNHKNQGGGGRSVCLFKLLEQSGTELMKVTDFTWEDKRGHLQCNTERQKVKLKFGTELYEIY